MNHDEHFNVKTVVNFAVDFNKIPGNEDLWIPRKVYNVCMVSGLAAENLSSVSRTFVTAWRSAMKLFIIWTNFLMG